MGDEDNVRLIWDAEEAASLKRQGWRSLYCCHTNSAPGYPSTLFWLMAPPEPPKPTLAERLDGVIDAADPHDIDCVPIFDAKAELRRLTKIEAAARYAVDHQTECGVVERLRNALER